MRVPQAHMCVDWPKLHVWMRARAARLEDMVPPDRRYMQKWRICSPYTLITQTERLTRDIAFLLLPLTAIKSYPNGDFVQGYAKQYMSVFTEELLCYVSEDIITVNLLPSRLSICLLD